MARKFDTYHVMLQHYATSRETRSSTMLAHKMYTNGGLLHDSPQTEERVYKNHRRTVSGDSSATTAAISADGSGIDGTGGSDGSGAAGEDNEEDGEADEDEPDEFAPSRRAGKRHGHQTGLSLTLTNTSLNAVNGRKRARSASSSGEDENASLMTVKRQFQKPAASAVTSDDDDDDYNAVDLISDSDGDDPDLEQLEEKMIIESEEEQGDEPATKITPKTIRRTSASSSQDWEGCSVDDGLMLADLPFFDESIRHGHFPLGEFDLDPCYAAACAGSESLSQSPRVRRVRFADDVSGSSSSTSSSSDVDNDIYPDLMQQDRLDPSFLQLIENDSPDDSQSTTDGDGSSCDLGHHEMENGLDDDGSSGSSSGYETDEGETTDEEVLPPTTINRPQSLLRLQSPSSARKSRPVSLRRIPLASGGRRQGPSLGSWVADPTKPIAIIDSSGKQMLFIPAPPAREQRDAKGPARDGSSSSSPTGDFTYMGNPFDDSENDRSDYSAPDYGSLTLNSTANLMRSDFFDAASGIEHIIGSQLIGPAEAMYPWRSIGLDGQVVDDDSDSYDDESFLNLSDFIDFGDDSSDSDQAEQEDNDATPTKTKLTHASHRQNSPSFHESPHGLLKHFDKGVVTSFRRNQHRHQALLRRPPISTSGLYGLKGGRHTTANTSISPLRKRKPNRSMSSSMISMNGVAAKRRVVSHKKHGSLG